MNSDTHISNDKNGKPILTEKQWNRNIFKNIWVIPEDQCNYFHTSNEENQGPNIHQGEGEQQ